MSNEPEDGYYQGTIADAYPEIDPQDEHGLVLAFEVKLVTGHEVTCRQRTTGKYPEIARAVVEERGLPWPEGIEQLHSTAGQSVRVQVKRNGDYINCYLCTKRARERAEPARVKSAIARLKGEPGADDVPF